MSLLLRSVEHYLRECRRTASCKIVYIRNRGAIPYEGPMRHVLRLLALLVFAAASGCTDPSNEKAKDPAAAQPKPAKSDS